MVWKKLFCVCAKNVNIGGKNGLFRKQATSWWCWDDLSEVGWKFSDNFLTIWKSCFCFKLQKIAKILGCQVVCQVRRVLTNFIFQKFQINYHTFATDKDKTNNLNNKKTPVLSKDLLNESWNPHMAKIVSQQKVCKTAEWTVGNMTSPHIFC